jgi:protein TonB
MQVGGVVKVQATIGKDGRVHDPHAVSGPEVLRAAAVDAVRTWLYKPRFLNGEPVDALTEIDIRFNPKGR